MFYVNPAEEVAIGYLLFFYITCGYLPLQSIIQNMKRSFTLLLLAGSALLSCKQNDPVPVTDIETAGAFMQDIWKLDFDKAEKLMLKDDMNDQLFNRFEQHMKAKKKEELDKYKNADFIINDNKSLNDSVSIINYSGSYNKAEKTDLKLVRKNGHWFVDLKYTLAQTDSTQK